jgi:hypothetical protein
VVKSGFGKAEIIARELAVMMPLRLTVGMPTLRRVSVHTEGSNGSVTVSAYMDLMDASLERYTMW